MTARSAPISTRRRSLGPGRLDGLRVRIVDDHAAGDVDLERVLRTLARLMVRSYQHAGDHEAISPVSQSSSTLTVSPNPRTDHVDDAA